MNSSGNDHKQKEVRASSKYLYERSKFAAREREAGLVDNKLKFARARSRGQRLLVEFFGVVGLGKSWLLSYLNEVHASSQDAAVVSALVSFETFNREKDWYPLLCALAEQVKSQVPDVDISPFQSDQVEDEKRSELSESFVNAVKGLLKSCTPLFLFDTSEKSVQLLDWLEAEIVYPLLRTNRVVFVFAGRRWLRWKRFEVRRRVETVSLGPFDRQFGIPEMLKKLGVDRTLAPNLYQYAFGHPLTTRVIVETFPEISTKLLEQNRPVIADAVYAQVVQSYFFKDLPQDLQFLLQVVCIPRKFDVTPLREFAARFGPEDAENYKDKPGGFYLDAIREMQDTTLVQWNSDWGGYILLPVLRWIIAKNLWMREPDKFTKWHQEAVEQYDDWISRYPRNAVGFLIERAFHQAWASRAEGKSEKVANQASNDFETMWEEVVKKPDVQWDLPEMVDKLKEKVQGDQELKTFFPELHFQLVQQVNKMEQP